MDLKSISYQPIGWIDSCFTDKFGTPRQPSVAPTAQARIRLALECNPVAALVGLEEFSHIWIIFHFHKNSNKVYSAKIRPPRLEGEKIGVLATRSPHRFNPIGLSLVRLEKIEKDSLLISGVDLIDGTPVLDIKPYIHEYDSSGDSRAGWTERVERVKLKVEFSKDVEKQIAEFENRDHRTGVKQLIEDILAQDPRNSMDREDSRSDKQLGFFIYNYNIVFQVTGGVAIVLRVEFNPHSVVNKN
jgi:tRNA-Thr(GGU) m(6)t(6)A37 methyltransferase TsaA